MYKFGRVFIKPFIINHDGKIHFRKALLTFEIGKKLPPNERWSNANRKNFDQITTFFVKPGTFHLKVWCFDEHPNNYADALLKRFFAK